ncbi:MAG: hypothetical protein FJ271_28300 [Planctomycetes bacterium]|nr:hypothetical protein [Planctomycetota bacterium]
METRLFALGVCSPRDQLRARQRARQIAGLLGFEACQQAALAAEVFAWLRAGRHSVSTRIAFVVVDRSLKVELGARRLSAPLPDKLPHAVEDVGWMIRELDRQAPFVIMEEVDAQNRELLAVADSQPLRNVPGLRVNESAA